MKSNSLVSKLSILVFIAALTLLSGCAAIQHVIAPTPTQAQADAAKAQAACQVADAGIEFITGLAKTGVLSKNQLNAADPYVKTIAGICSGPTPPTLVQVGSAAFNAAVSGLASVPSTPK